MKPPRRGPASERKMESGQSARCYRRRCHFRSMGGNPSRVERRWSSTESVPPSSRRGRESCSRLLVSKRNHNIEPENLHPKEQRELERGHPRRYSLLPLAQSPDMARTKPETGSRRFLELFAPSECEQWSCTASDVRQVQAQGR